MHENATTRQGRRRSSRSRPTPRKTAPSPTPTAACSASAPAPRRPGDIRPNIQVLAELSSALGHDTGIDSQPTAFAALTDAVPFYAGITDADIGGRGIRWQDTPLPRALPSVERRRPGLRGRSARSRRTLSATARPPTRGVAPADSSAATLPRPRHLPRPLGGADHRAEPAAEVPDAAAAARAVSLADAERLGLKSGDKVRVGQNGTSVEATVADQGARRRGRLLPRRGHRRGQRQRPAQRRPGPGRDHEAERGPGLMLPLADTQFVEATWIMIVKSLVIFAVIFGDPADPDRGRAQADRPLPAPLRPQPGRPVRHPAAACRRRQADLQGVLPARQRGLDPVHPRAAAAGPLRRPRPGDHPLGRRPGRRRPLRDRRPDRHPLLLRRRLDRLLRPAARRLVLGLQIQPARARCARPRS